MIIISSTNFDLAQKRKKLYKRKKKRKRILGLFILIFSLFIFSLFIIINMQNRNKTVANFIITSPKIVNNEKFIVCIDPGHGDFDIGTEGINNSTEKDIVLSIGLYLKELLDKDNSIKVIYTRTGDSMPWLTNANDSLKERINISKISNADIFISIHCNSNEAANDANGIETWYKPTSSESERLASIIQSELVSLNYSSDRGIKYYSKDNELAVVEKNSAISVLTEVGFLSNRDDERYLTSKTGQKACAEALYKAIIKYKQELLSQ